jgi:hypothetical protein
MPVSGFRLSFPLKVQPEKQFERSDYEFARAISSPALFSRLFVAMKSPRDLAEGMKIRKSDDAFFRETFRLPRSEARRRAKQLFSEFPSATYMTEIETWRESEGIVEFQMKRLNDPLD